MIKTLNSDEDSLSPFGHMLASAKSTIVANNCISFSHVCRLGNIHCNKMYFCWQKFSSPKVLFFVARTFGDKIYFLATKLVSTCIPHRQKSWRRKISYPKGLTIKKKKKKEMKTFCRLMFFSLNTLFSKEIVSPSNDIWGKILIMVAKCY